MIRSCATGLSTPVFSLRSNPGPASFFAKDLASLVTIGNLEDDFDVIAEADWVIEAIIERLDIKQDLMARIDEDPLAALHRQHQYFRYPGGRYCPETLRRVSGSISSGTHFFNPPRYLKLLEIIPTPDTLPEVVDFIHHFGEYRLGKGIVPCKDTPNFIGNRLLSGTNAFTLHYALENGYTVDEVDAITGPAIGRPKTATFRLIDLVGLDVLGHVTTNLIPAIPHDEHALRYLQSKSVNGLMNGLIEKGWLGNKTKCGFYKMTMVEGKKQFWPLDLQTQEHVAPTKPRFDSVGDARKKETLPEKMTVFIEGEDRAAEFVRAITFQSFAYASEMIPEIADTPKPLDDAMRWGFGHEAGPFELWDSLGVAAMIPKMEAAGFPPAPWVAAMLENGITSFYQYEGQRKAAVFNVAKGAYEAIPKDPLQIILQEEKDAGKLVGPEPRRQPDRFG